MQDGSAPGWRQILDRHHMALVDELTAQLDSEIESCLTREREQSKADREQAEAAFARALSEERARAVDDSSRRLSESLNQSLRRIRQTSAEHETLQLLLEDSTADCSVVLLIENNQARVAAWRGVTLREEDREEDEARPIDLTDAAALASCVESRDPMVAVIAPGEISSLLASALAGEGNARVYLFPVTVRQNTIAVVMACGNVIPAPIELLCEAAGMKLEALQALEAVPITAPLAAKAAPPEHLVQIAAPASPTAPASRAEEPPTWSALSPDEQALHLRAQRFARVRVAQIRISESLELREGTQAANIYGLLRQSIDAARDEYQRSYKSQSPTMVDYLHLEIVRSLAHDDAGLMGLDYPGPLK